MPVYLPGSLASFIRLRRTVAQQKKSVEGMTVIKTQSTAREPSVYRSMIRPVSVGKRTRTDRSPW